MNRQVFGVLCSAFEKTMERYAEARQNCLRRHFSYQCYQFHLIYLLLFMHSSSPYSVTFLPIIFLCPCTTDYLFDHAGPPPPPPPSQNYVQHINPDEGNWGERGLVRACVYFDGRGKRNDQLYANRIGQMDRAKQFDFTGLSGVHQCIGDCGQLFGYCGRFLFA